METQHIHNCDCGEILAKTSGEAEGRSELYECPKCGRMWRFEAEIVFKKQELTIKEQP